jgi:hypothetical protein
MACQAVAMLGGFGMLPSMAAGGWRRLYLIIRHDAKSKKSANRQSLILTDAIRNTVTHVPEPDMAIGRSIHRCKGV